MTSRERIDAAMQREQPDMVPIFLRDLTLGLDVCDFTTLEVCAGPDGRYDADKSAHCVIETQRLLGHDCVVGGVHGLGIDAEILGGRVDFPERGIPRVATPPFSTAQAAADTPIPDLRTEGRMPGLLRSYRIVAEAAGSEGGFILMPSCSIHRGLPIEHPQAMIEAAPGHPGAEACQN